MKHEGTQEYSQAAGLGSVTSRTHHSGIISPWIPSPDTAKVLRWPQALQQQKCTCTFFWASFCHLLGCESSAVPVLEEMCGEGTWTQGFPCSSPTLSSAASCFGELTWDRKAEPLAAPLCSAFIIPCREQVPWHEWGFRFDVQSCCGAQELLRAQHQLQGLWNQPLLKSVLYSI